jgi:hypothetical protein
MKTKNFCLLIAVLAFSFGAYAQDCSAFYPFREGAKMEYTNYDKKGKVESTTQNTVKVIKETASGLVAEVSTLIQDKKEKEVYSGTLEVRCEDGKLTFDLNSMIDPAIYESLSSMEIQLEGDALQMPNSLSVGQELPDASMKITAGTGGMTIMTTNIKIVNRKVEGKETITTSAGTFECYKLSQTTEVKMMISRSFDSVEYFAEGVGMVRTENYDKKGKLESYTELTAFEK